MFKFKKSVCVSIDKVGEAYEKAFEELYNNDEPWFTSEEEAENWAGDVAFDFVLSVLEAMGIEVVEEE